MIIPDRLCLKPMKRIFITAEHRLLEKKEDKSVFSIPNSAVLDNVSKKRVQLRG
ncbi:MAG: hypothetical protein R6U32_03050 [Candidatus Woesearchaeota archaeon]